MDTKIGRIPREWRVARLGEIISDEKYAMVDGPFGSNLKSIHYRSEGIPIFQSGFVTTGKFKAGKYLFVDEAKFQEQNRSAAKGGDILMAKIGVNAGACAIIPQNHPVGILAGNSLKITPDDSKCRTEYLNIFLQRHKELGRFDRIASATAQPALSLRSLRKLLIAVPPLPEQKKIAQILSTVDEQISTTEKIIEKSKELKKGLMQKLFSEGIGHTEFKETKVGRIPKEWGLLKVGDIADVKGGKRVPKGHKLTTERTDFPYIRVADMSMMKVDVKNLLYLSGETQELINRYTISSDDVFVSVAGTVGVVGVIPESLNGANLTENADKLCNLQGVDKLFLAYLLSSNIGQKQIQSFIGVGAQPKLALNRLKKILVPIPPFAEQQRISQILTEFDRKTEAEELFRSELHELKKGLMQELLTGKKRVKV
ncbi:MAG: restriction endonuclease subunit S [Flavobacteriales bacterium]